MPSKAPPLGGRCGWCGWPVSALRITMMTWHGNTVCITGHLWGESTGHRWISLRNGQQCRTLIFVSLLLTWPSWWANSWDASDLRFHAAHVMSRSLTCAVSMTPSTDLATSLAESISCSWQDGLWIVGETTWKQNDCLKTLRPRQNLHA